MGKITCRIVDTILGKAEIERGRKHLEEALAKRRGQLRKHLKAGSATILRSPDLKPSLMGQ